MPTIQQVLPESIVERYLKDAPFHLMVDGAIRLLRSEREDRFPPETREQLGELLRMAALAGANIAKVLPAWQPGPLDRRPPPFTEPTVTP